MADIFTFQDVVEHLLDTYDLPRSSLRSVRQARRAVMVSYLDLPNKHRWSYFQRRMQVITDASQTTGTVVYDHTGGTYERELTLTSSTWPSNAAYGNVIIDEKIYKIDERKSSTVVTLREDRNPGADVASTTYTYYRSAYPLSAKFVRATPVAEIGQSYRLTYVQPSSWLDYSIGNYSPQRPNIYTFRGDGATYGEMLIEFMPPPSESRTYDFMAEVSPRSIAIERENAGTVACTAGSTTVTGTGTDFTSSMIGSMLRVSLNSEEEPTGLAGGPGEDGDGVFNPYFAQRKITAVASSTSLTIESAVSSSTALTESKYSISDPIDIEPGAMYTHFLRMCEVEMANLINAEDYETRLGRSSMSLRLAMAADSRSKDFGYPGTLHDGRMTSLGDWAIIQ